MKKGSSVENRKRTIAQCIRMHFSAIEEASSLSHALRSSATVPRLETQKAAHEAASVDKLLLINREEIGVSNTDDLPLKLSS